MKPVLLLLLVSVFCFQDSLSQEKIKNKQATTLKKESARYGLASFYAKKFNNRKTASGERYNPEKFTAACNVLPLGSWIKVTNLRNKKSVIVKTNDRLHPKNKRLVDLSWVAAKKLDYTSRGLTRVKVEVLKNYRPGPK